MLKKLSLYFVVNRVFVKKHTFHALVFTTIATLFHLAIPGMLAYLPLVLIFNLLVYNKDIEVTKKKAKTLSITLVPALPLAILISLFFRDYSWLVPVFFFVYMCILRGLQLPNEYVFGGILILVSFFSQDTWLFYVFLTIDVIIFSLLALWLAKFFTVTTCETFRSIYKEEKILFNKLLIDVLENRFVEVSIFFEGFQELQNTYELMKSDITVSNRNLLQYDQLLFEMEESYFYLRNLIDAPIKLTQNLFVAYTKAGIILDGKLMLLGATPYDFHAKNLLRHYKQWQRVETVLKEEKML